MEIFITKNLQFLILIYYTIYNLELALMLFFLNMI